MDRHQEIMNQAYDKFNDGISHAQWHETLTELEKRAVVLGNMSYQVLNGGFHQWVSNGYYLDGALLIAYLTEMDTKLSRSLIRIVNKVLSYTNPDAKRAGMMGRYWKHEKSNGSRWRDEEEENDVEEVVIDLDEHDNEYYSFSSDFDREVEEYLAAYNGERSGITVNVPHSRLVQSDAYCNKYGLSVWCVNEGRVRGEETVQMPIEVARKYNFV